MKTLKKTLCLVLAMVMVFGLCAVSASAKLDSYTDKDDITYAEAVDVMSGIGILQGDERGFRPTDDITRAEAAKIISYLLIGNSTQADALKTTSAPFTDVPASHWAAGYISYCATSGIIGGMGDGTYHPSDKVTGLQFAKMLLCAIGYGVNDEYTGADWAINVSREALRLGVFDDNLAGANNNAATREECALYAFNVAAKSRNVSDGKGGTTKQYGLAKVSYSALLGGYITTGVLSGNDSPDANKAATIADDFKLKSEDKAKDAFNRDTGHHWYIDTAKKPIITAEYDADANLKNIYTTKVTGDDIYQLLGDDASKSSTVLNVYVNSKTAATDASYDKDNFVKGNDTQLAGTGNGVQTYVYSWYSNGNMQIKICIIDSYIAKVTDVKAATAKKDPVTTIAYFGDAGGSPNTLSAPSVTTYNTDEFAKGDYVFVTVAGGEIRSMTAVNVIEDTISRYNYNQSKTEASIVSGGETYVAAKNAAKYVPDDIKAADDTGSVNKNVVNGKDHALYVDEFGYLYSLGDVDAESVYVYAAKFGTVSDSSGEFLDSNIGVKLYYADGTNKTLTLKTDFSGDAYANAIKPGADQSVSAFNTEKAGKIYKLEMDGDKAILHALTDSKSGGNVKPGISTSVGGTSVKATNKTVFFYVKCTGGNPYEYGTDDFGIAAYVGINNVPANTKDGGAVPIQLVADGGDVVAVLVDDAVSTDNDTVYFYTGSYSSRKDGDNWIVSYDVYVDGEPTTLEVPYDKAPGAGVDYETLKNQFVILNGKTLTNASKINAYAEHNKYKYAWDVNPIGNVDENTLTIVAGSQAAAIANAKFVDLTVEEGGITSADALVTAAGRTGAALTVAVQYYGPNVVVYIVAHTEGT